MGTPRITALIDTFNHGRFIDEAIESVLAQDFPASKMEILVVDDGSTDDTRERVAKFQDRVRCLWKPNGGQASALNLGFEQARGEIVAMLDGDDVWLPSKLRRVVEAFEENPGAVEVYHPCISWRPEESLYLPDPGFHPVSGKMPLSLADLLRYGDHNTSSIALHRERAAALFPLPGSLRIYADSYLIFLAPFTGRVVGIGEQLTRYRLHDANLASMRTPHPERLRQRWSCYADAVAESKNWLTRSGFDLAEPWLAAYVKRHELVEQMLRFYCEPPGRREYFRHLRAFQKLYRPLWTRRYSTFRTLLSFTGFVLGYKGLVRLQKQYRRTAVPLRLRRGLFPANTVEAATQ